MRILDWWGLAMLPGFLEGDGAAGGASDSGTDGDKTGDAGDGDAGGTDGDKTGDAGDGKTSIAGGDSGDASKAGGQSKDSAATGAPDEYKFTFPDGVEADKDLVGAFSEAAKTAGLPQDAAQAILDVHTKSQAAQVEAWQTQVTAWESEVKADSEIGGDNYENTVRNVRGVIEKFGTPDLKEYLNSTGFGNHPALVRFVANVAKAMGEDSASGSRVGATPESDEMASLQKRYPSMFNEDGTPKFEMESTS